MQEKLTELKNHLLESNDLGMIGSLLNWDQSTYMPPAGAASRGRHMALLARLAHEKATDPVIGKLLDELQPWAEQLPYDSDDAATVRVARRNFERQVKVPAHLLSAFYEHIAVTYQAWTRARPNNDFASLQPLLEKTLDLSRRYAECFAPFDHIADPLINEADFGMKAASVRKLFGQLRAELVPLVQTIASQPVADDSCLRQHFPESAQRAFGESIIRDYGFDFNRGRQDTTHHPFMTKFASDDVRITTRFDENDLSGGLFSTLHECGHALYELGINPAYEGTPLDGGASAGVHESQSRLWENIVGRSLGFWQKYYPALQDAFPSQLGTVSLDTFYRAINKVQRSLIRTESDEVTYNLHVIIRFDLELALLEGSLAIKDLPEAWHARYESDLGLRAPSDVDGCLQDVHWYGGAIGGAFQGYTIGNILSAQFYQTAVNAHPTIPTEITHGQFATLHGWLKDNLYIHGSKFTAPELIRRVTGTDLDIQPYIQYLKQKYGGLYPLY